MENESQVSEATEATPVEATPDAAPERPEWLPEKFNKPEDLAQSYNALSAKLGEKEDDVRARLMEELQQQASEGVPEKAERALYD